MSGTYSNAPYIEEGYQNFHHTSNSRGIFSKFTLALGKNSKGGYEGPDLKSEQNCFNLPKYANDHTLKYHQKTRFPGFSKNKIL
jgi:hypothetical protein